MSDLTHWREEIDRIDQSLTQLFEQRMKAAYNIGKYKLEHGLPTLNSVREQQVIEQSLARLDDQTLEPYLEQFYQHLMQLSRDYQNSLAHHPKTIGFQGVEGSFSHEACLKYTQGASYLYNKYETFNELCMALLNGEVDCAVIPVENSSTGSVVDVYDLLLKYQFYIIGEECVRVNHNLVAKPGTKIGDITEVYSHPQAFMQCREYLKNFNFKQIPYHNTAISAKYVSEQNDGHIAAIASVQAAKLYHLNVIDYNINYNVNNITKFIVLSKTEEKRQENNKVSVVLSLENKAGTLFSMMQYFNQYGINMLKIESRPDVNNPFHYIFFIDFEGNVQDDITQKVLELLRQHSKHYKFLGNYQADEGVK